MNRGILRGGLAAVVLLASSTLPAMALADEEKLICKQEWVCVDLEFVVKVRVCTQVTRCYPEETKDG